MNNDMIEKFGIFVIRVKIATLTLAVEGRGGGMRLSGVGGCCVATSCCHSLVYYSLNPSNMVK